MTGLLNVGTELLHQTPAAEDAGDGIGFNGGLTCGFSDERDVFGSAVGALRNGPTANQVSDALACLLIC